MPRPRNTVVQLWHKNPPRSILTRPVGTGGAGGASAPPIFCNYLICSLNFRENIARPYYKFAKILTSSVTSYPFQSFIACSKNQRIVRVLVLFLLLLLRHVP